MKWFRDLKVAMKLLLSFLVLSAFTALIGYFAIANMAKINDLLEKTYQKDLLGISAIKEANATLLSLDRAVKNLLMSSSQDDRDKYLAQVEQYRNDFQSQSNKARGFFYTEKAKVLFSDLDKAWDDFRPVLAKTVDMARHDPVGDKRDSVEYSMGVGRAKMDSLSNLTTSLAKAKEDAARISSEEAGQVYSASRDFMIVLVLASLMIGAGLGFFISRLIAKPLTKIAFAAESIAGGNLDVHSGVEQADETGQLAASLRKMVGSLKDRIVEANAKSEEAARAAVQAHKAEAQAEKAQADALSKRDTMLNAAVKLQRVAEVTTSASEQLSAQIEQSSRGAEQQSRRVSETATAMEEMNATVMEVAKNAAQAAQSSDTARQKAQSGAEIVSEVVMGINYVQKQALGLKQDMASLGKQAEGIGAIMNVISDIADQTNLLALNAAIEAARAGDAGRGFAVVADEVRKLAEKTMTATKEVGQAIRGIQEGTSKNLENVDRTVLGINQATTLAKESGEALEEIVRLVDVATDQVRSIATASEQQSAASEEINRSIEDVNTISAETAEAMTQAAQAVSELANQNLDLKSLIDHMQSDDDEKDSYERDARPRASLALA